MTFWFKFSTLSIAHSRCQTGNTFSLARALWYRCKHCMMQLATHGAQFAVTAAWWCSMHRRKSGKTFAMLAHSASFFLMGWKIAKYVTIHKSVPWLITQNSTIVRIGTDLMNGKRLFLALLTVCVFIDNLFLSSVSPCKKTTYKSTKAILSWSSLRSHRRVMALNYFSTFVQLSRGLSGKLILEHNQRVLSVLQNQN